MLENQVLDRGRSYINDIACKITKNSAFGGNISVKVSKCCLHVGMEKIYSVACPAITPQRELN